MFDLHPILWLQGFASPVLTGVMNAISLVGYTRAFVVFATVLIFGFRQRAAVALLVLIALSGAFTDIAKAAAETPRPDGLDSRVQALSIFAERLRAREADTPTEMEDTYSFPSGHVSATTVFLVGSALLFQWRRRGWIVAVTAIALMGVSRMYLGRHFPGDILGGVAIGLGTIALGFSALRLDHLAREVRAHDAGYSAHRVMAVAIVLAAGALLAGLPDAGDAGRLLGTAVGVLVLAEHHVFEFASTRTARVLLVAVGAVAFGAAWGLMTWLLGELQPSGVSAMRLAVSALPNAALLVVPAAVSRWGSVRIGTRRRAPSG